MVNIDKYPAPTRTHAVTGESLELDARYGEGCSEAIESAYQLLRLVPESAYDSESTESQWISITPADYIEGENDTRLLLSFTLASPYLHEDPDFPGGAFFDFDISDRRGRFSLSCTPEVINDKFDLTYQVRIASKPGELTVTRQWSAVAAKLDELCAGDTQFERYKGSQMEREDKNPLGSLAVRSFK